MRRIFSKQKMVENVAEVFRYDYHESLDVCMSQSAGLYYSNGSPINLSQKKPKATFFFPVGIWGRATN